MTQKFHLDHYPLWTAVVTPFHEKGELDLDSFKELLRLQEKASNAILLLGSTGEAMALSDDEKKLILKTALEMNLQVPLMVGIGGIHLEQTLAWLSYLETLPLDCYLMVTPIYAKPGAKGQEEWFRALLDRATRPCMLYNVPGRTAVKLNESAIKQLEGHKNFWAVKEASGSISSFQSFRKATPSIEYFSGDDGMTPYFSIEGARGLISVASNIWPLETHLYTKRCLEKNFEGLMPLWSEASDSLFSASNPIPVKAILHHEGLIKTPRTRAPLSHKDLSEQGMKDLLSAHQRITSWYKAQKESK